MKNTFRLLVGLSAIATAGMILFGKRHRKKVEMLKKVSDEGYETALDILFPVRSNRAIGLKLGPVIPQ